MKFTKDFLKNAIDILAEEGKIFSNERQFQLELALKLSSNFKVELEVLSSDKKAEELKTLKKEEREKLYSDIIVQDDDGYIVIELKYKTPQMPYVYKNKNGIQTITFAQGATDLGSFQFWKDVERIEKLKTFTLNFDESKKLNKGYAVLLTNANDYWEGKPDSLCSEFFPVGNMQKVLHWQIKLDKSTNSRVSGKTANEKCYKKKVEKHEVDLYRNQNEKEIDSNITPIELNNEYDCSEGKGWYDYNVSYTPNTLPKFRYLLLEIDI